MTRPASRLIRFAAHLRRPLVLLLVLLLAVAVGEAQAGTTGKIAGRITDSQTGETIIGASVLVLGTTLGAATDLDGNYTILNVPPGVVTLRVSSVGYGTKEIQNVRVSVDFTTRQDIKLEPTALQLNAVEVVVERDPLIRQDLTNPTVAIGAEQIAALPVTSFTELVRLQAGVTVGNGGELHIRGGRSNEIAYQIDGVSANNPFDNSLGVGVATNAIQELSVSTGTFSAEYGNALSGVVNFVTKEGSERFTGSVRAFTGDFAPNAGADALFPGISTYEPFDNQRVELTLGGPIPLTDSRLRFFLSGVYEDRAGYLRGERRFVPSQSDSGNVVGNESVAMNPRIGRNVTGNLSFRPSPALGITYGFVGDRGTSQSYSRAYRFLPDGRATNYAWGQKHSLGITQTLSNKLFYQAKGSYSQSHAESYAFEDPFSPNYILSRPNDVINGTDVLFNGIDLGHSDQTATTWAGKIDATAQPVPTHEIKFGGEVRSHILRAESFNGVYTEEVLRFFDDLNSRRATAGQPAVTPRPIVTNSTAFYDGNTIDPLFVDYVDYLRRTNDNFDESKILAYNAYEQKPVQVALYALDKIELARTFILNIGGRYEYFNTRANYQPDLSGTLSDPSQGLAPAKAKHLISPRLSVSYPITDQGVLRFSYGHFYQTPNFSSLYSNSLYRSLDDLGTSSFGNPNLEPEKSIQYEMGLQQGLGSNLKLDLTAFYKDVSNYLEQQLVRTGASNDKLYLVWANLNYARVKGVTVSFLQRRTGLFGASVDYTYSVAEGNRTDADAFSFNQNTGKATPRIVIPLSFDRSHVLNATATISKANQFSIGLTSSLQTGTPYSPILPDNLKGDRAVDFGQNSDRRPLSWTVDLRAEKFLRLGPVSTSVFLQVDNLFDRRNEVFVFTSTGRALYSLDAADPALLSEARRRASATGAKTLSSEAVDAYYQRPEWLAPPREVRIGLTTEF